MKTKEQILKDQIAMHQSEEKKLRLQLDELYDAEGRDKVNLLMGKYFVEDLSGIDLHWSTNRQYYHFYVSADNDGNFCEYYRVMHSKKSGDIMISKSTIPVDSEFDTNGFVEISDRTYEAMESRVAGAL